MILNILDFIQELLLKFPTSIEIEDTQNNYLDVDVLLFKKHQYNEYLVLHPEKYNEIKVELFKSNQKNFEKIENDYVDDTFSFKFKNIEDFKTFINAIN